MDGLTHAGQVALVTGSGGDIGGAIAARMASAGAFVAAADLSLPAAERTAEVITTRGFSAAPFEVDVRSRPQVEAMLDAIERAAGPVTLVVAAAGVVHPVPFLDLEEVDWQRTLAVNLNGVFHVIQATARRLIGTPLGGSFVAISSVSGRGPRPDQADYAASKAAVISLVQSAAVALAPHRIRVNAVCPGVVEGGMTRRLHQARAARLGITPEESLARLMRTVALGRAAQPGEVADVVAYLLSPNSGYITGQSINVCGGLAFN
jgi:NAD(P)-dependent dehydrogenase (short-subunit alcohol dehydrogenase family)